MKDIRLPQQLTRAMAAEAEAAREARAKVVAAEGEQKVNLCETYYILFSYHKTKNNQITF